MAQLAIGSLVQRLVPSTTGRDIMPGDIGRIDMINGPFKYFPVQWVRTGLWSMLHPDDLGTVYNLHEFPTPVQ